jgi:hypothetical protein
MFVLTQMVGKQFKYNESLSIVDRTISWLIKNGIDAKRLTGRIW